MSISMDTADRVFWHPDNRLKGYRFDPTDEELIAYYLSRKVQADHRQRDQVPFYDVMIPTVDLYEAASSPWSVCRRLAYPYGMGTTEFYCFTPRKPRNGGDSHANRTAGFGTWTANGGDNLIHSNGVIVGHKLQLSFKVPPPGSSGRSVGKSDMVTTHWVMHEYRLARPGFQKLVLCRVRNLRKECEQEKALWSPPWWEQQEEGCSIIGVQQRKTTSSRKDKAVVPPQRLRYRRPRGSKGKEPAEVAPPPGDAGVPQGGSKQRQQQPPCFTAAPENVYNNGVLRIS